MEFIRLYIHLVYDLKNFFLMDDNTLPHKTKADILIRRSKMWTWALTLLLMWIQNTTDMAVMMYVFRPQYEL